MSITDLFRKWSRDKDQHQPERPEPTDFVWQPDLMPVAPKLPDPPVFDMVPITESLKHIDWGAVGGFAVGGYTHTDSKTAEVMRQKQDELVRHLEEAQRQQRIMDATRTLRREGQLVLKPEALAAALHRAGASLDLIHETASWLEEAFPGFDRMDFLASIDWTEEPKKDTE